MKDLMTETQRIMNYQRQNGCTKITPRQMRRVQKKYNRALAYTWMHGKRVRLVGSAPPFYVKSTLSW